MNISEIFIRRPIMTTLLMLALLVFGIMGYRALPISDLPNIDFPTIQVTASLPGASPDTMASSVATPLERQFSTIAGIDSMSSTSTLGQTQITLQFHLERSIDAAAQDVQSAISRAVKQLPINMPSPPTFTKVNPSAAPILYLALSSTTLPLYDVDRYAETYLAQRISMISGVAEVAVYGSQKYAVRVKVNPDFLSAYQISLDDVASAIKKGNVNLPTGLLEGSRQRFLIQAHGELKNAAEFRPLIIAYRNGAPVRLENLGEVVDSVSNDKVASWLNGQRAIILAVQRQPGTNTIEVVNNIKKILPVFEKQLPGGIKLSILYDRSQSIRASVYEVQLALLIAAFLVIFVIFLFLRNGAATFIASIALPLSIIGTFAIMWYLQFSLDNLSLLALTLVVGFVVDDAIVMLENIYRYIEQGMDAFHAALTGSKKISFTIISMTLSLAVVFVPVLFMGGLLGRMLHEFGMTIVTAILISGLISLTLTPMLCSRLLTPRNLAESKFRFLTYFGDVIFPKMYERYRVSLEWALAHQKIIFNIFLATLALSALLFYLIPKGFLPSEDTGQLFGYTEADPSVSFQEMSARQQKVASIIQENENIESVMSSVGAGGVGGANSGRIFMRLKPRFERPLSADHLAQVLRKQVAVVPGIKIYLQNIPAISVGPLAKSQYQYTIQSSDQNELSKWADIYLNEIKKIPGTQDVTTTLQFTGPQAEIEIDRNKASGLGVTAEQVENSLQYAYGSQIVSTIYTDIDSYDVILQLVMPAQTDPTMLSRLYVHSSSGKLIPLSTISTITMGAGPLSINHQGQLPAATISFNLTPNTSLGTVVNAVEKLRTKLNVPATLLTGFRGTAQTFQSSVQGLGILLIFSILIIYILLGILYESFIHPLTILSGLPAAAAGALLTLLIFGIDLNFYSFIGIIMLIGIVKKNAIMMIDFAIDAERTEGKKPEEAIYQACLIRFRPIMMTTMAAIMSTLPVAFAFGTGSEARRPLGLAVLGGLLVSQLLTLYITPVIYLYFERAHEKGKKYLRRKK